jgi:autotransporter strand-loop-strand O-heptosyltransferase
MVIKAHTSIIGETGYNCHSRNFFKSLDKLNTVQVRNFTIGSTWNGYNNDEPHNNEYYIDDQLKKMLVEQTLGTPDGRQDFPLYTNYKNGGSPDVHIVLNETDHYYFYDDYDGIKIAYNVWETTRQPDNFFERLKTYDQIWVPSKWQRQCTIDQGIPPEKVKVVPEGVDVDMYKPINRVVSRPMNRPFRFLLVGRWDYRKSTREIIESFTNTFSEDEDVEMILSIDNPFANDGLNSTEERLEKFGIHHKGLKVVHHLSKEEYVNMIKTSDVFVSCARGEGWNLPLIEAMSSGIPSLYSNWGAQLEFAEDKGIPVNILHEINASIQTDDYKWIENAPGMYAEPDFNDLSIKLRNVYENYLVHKRKALNDSDEIRKIFTWDNAAETADIILSELINGKKLLDDSVAIVLSHANNPDRISILKECIRSISIPVILSTNYPVDIETQTMCDWVVYSKENPILDSSEFEKYGVNYYHWWIDGDGNKHEKLYESEHGYAAYSLTREGIKFAKTLGKKKVHIINYDYTFSDKILEFHENELKNNDIVFYKQSDWEFDGNASYNSAFISAKIDPIEEFFSKYNSKDDYYYGFSGFNILERQLYTHYIGRPYKILELDIQDLKLKVKVNQINVNQYMNKLGEKNHIGKTFKEISDYFDCDKTTYHTYHEYYPMFLEKWRGLPINIFEIGIDDGKSLDIWKNYFPYSMIWGMDISRKYESERYKVFIGDQSNYDDLVKISSQVPKCKLIVDDGSHVADHQINTFNYLFENLLDFGGVYIIEDIECSYWHELQTVYGYETGNLNIVDYFTKLNHSVNDHYSEHKNPLHIKSITFAANCIIIQKKEIGELDDREYRFNDKFSFPKINKPIKSSSIADVSINFIDGPFVEVKSDLDSEYLVEFIDKDTNNIVYKSYIYSNHWVRSNRKWFTNWKIRVYHNDNLMMEYDFDLKDKKVFIVFESSSLGDTIAWIPYVEEFRKKHDCKVVVSTFLNNLLKDQYPEIEFVEPGSSVNNLYALYRIGCFYDNNSVDFNKHKTDFRKLRLQEYITDILGLEFKEILPKMPDVERMKSERPYICIANHSTAQTKYWNNPTGWQELVDYVKSIGYDVYLLSREEDGYMGNKNPNGVIKISNKTLQEISSILLGSKLFVGISSGLSWLSWSLGIETILISGTTDKILEPTSNIHRIINETVCHGCFSRHLFDKGDWNWCPDHKGTERQFECTKSITFEMVKPKIDKMLNI